MSTSTESEIALIGATMLEASTIADTRKIVGQDDFIDTTIGKAYAVLCDASDAGEPVDDLSTIARLFIAAGLWEQLGGNEGVRLLFAGCPNPQFAEHYAKAVKRDSVRRQAKDRSKDLQRRLDDVGADPLDSLQWFGEWIGRQKAVLQSQGKTLLKPASELLDAYLGRIADGKLPQLFRLGDALDGIEIGSELITVVGAPPGLGKTAMASQITFDTLYYSTDSVAYLLNAEMGFDAVLRREFTRLTRIKSDWIRFGNLSVADMAKIDGAAVTLRKSMERLSVYEDPSIECLNDLMDKPPGLVVVDYLQKFAPPDKDIRSGVGLVMSILRQLAKQGHAVLALSATKRDTKGNHNSQELSLSSFKESGEVEYQADSAYVLRDDGDHDGLSHIRKITLRHCKNRHGAKVDRQLVFDMPGMRFDAAIDEPQPHDDFDEYATTDVGFCFGGDR